MPPKTTNWRLLAKMIGGGSIICIGGPALVYYVTPTEEALFQKYNPDLQKRSLENRIGRQQDFDDFVGKLKDYSKSSRPIWEVAAEDERRSREGRGRQGQAAEGRGPEEQLKLMEETRRRKEEMRRESGVKSVPGGSL